MSARRAGDRMKTCTRTDAHTIADCPESADNVDTTRIVHLRLPVSALDTPKRPTGSKRKAAR
jgi:hypothetical protein